ncbi:hypothetical protein RM780_16385 [Streptomyces sp. DSM 44917]|uniref:Protein kinase domain-containing protein n=1 Tax=Streptomyces boetiae TaxID=3075541 RepID=A0ABU2LAC0_9ACTN|nr:hypothetical protein [Streptomyces sp. DSM 44917]MDT0308524.1 hypothetical protein [Streptomyces sp. DSM 44917]
MDSFAGRLLADRYRLPRTPAEEFELIESRAFDTVTNQEVLVRQVPLPEVVDAEPLDGAGRRAGPAPRASERPTRTPEDPVVRRAVEAAIAAAGMPEHPRLDQVFDVFVQGDGLWIVSELLPGARPLAVVLAEERLGPFRAAEVAADLLAALRIVHAQGWTHRNVTARSVLICEDGRAVLTGMAAGAAEEALCGYDPLPPDVPDTFAPTPRETPPAAEGFSAPAAPRHDAPGLSGPAPSGPASPGTDPRGREASGPGAGRDTSRPGARGSGASERGFPGPRPASPSAGGGLPGPDASGRDSSGPGFPGTADAPGPGSRAPGASGADAAGPGAARGGGYPDHGAPGPEAGSGFPGHGAVGSRFSGAGSSAPGFAGPGAAGDDASGSGFRAPDAAGAGPSAPGFPERGAAGAGSPAPGRDGFSGVGPPGPDAGYGADEERAGRSPDAPDASGSHRDLADRVREHGGVVPSADGPPPDAYRRWDTGALPRVEPGADGGTGARSGRPPAPGAAERAARSGAIAAYRAGTQAAAARRAAANGAQGPGSPGVAPTDLPGGAARPSHPVRTGWEPGPPPGAYDGRGRSPEEPYGPGGAADEPYDGHSSLDDLLGPRPSEGEPFDRERAAGEGRPPAGDAAVPGPREERPAAAVPAAAPPPPAAVRATVPVRARERYRGPDSALAAERARQARIMTVGAVTERWAPEQAGPVYEHWRLAPPVGPPADFWALGALLFRAVQGYPPYPEDSAAELAQAVCAEQPAFAEDCGALRPIIESLLRQDPTERPSGEALRGWLRSLLRSAPEPEAGHHTVTAPPPALEPGRPADPRRLPILRRRGELVGPRRRPRARARRRPREGGSRLGRTLVTLVLLGLAGAVAYVLAFMSEEDQPGGQARQDPAPQEPEGRESPSEPSQPDPEPSGAAGTEPEPSESEDDSNASPNEGDQLPVPPPDGFAAREDARGFALAVPEGWERRETGGEQVIYTDGTVEIVVVPGRDTTGDFAAEPMDYQLQEQPELDAFRAYRYAVSSGLYERRIGDMSMAEGIFDWQEGGTPTTAYNRVMLIEGSYHVVLVRGPSSERDRLSEIYGVTAGSYRLTG